MIIQIKTPLSHYLKMEILYLVVFVIHVLYSEYNRPRRVQ